MSRRGPRRAASASALLAGCAGLGAISALIAVIRAARLASTDADAAVIRTLRRVGREPIRVLCQGGAYQSATYIGKRWAEPVFAYHRALDALFAAEEDLIAASGHAVRDVLMIGGGGYAYPKHALLEHPEIRMDVVEIDARIERLARRWFYLDRLISLTGSRLRCITADGRSFLESAGRCYDAIINDSFIGRAPARDLATLEAARAVSRRLNPGGVYLANVSTECDGADPAFLRRVCATLAPVFDHVRIIDATDEELAAERTYLVIAGDGDHVWSESIAYDESFLGEVLLDAEAPAAH
ncbi:Spermine synthase [Coriobacterium glomerans PW2]|uniref:Spermine synthase n=1 Tax=Coriobacterium glomerans (strain ATCC 49209 / DSM 20642 / JCM 10262 / PW2) TaxID=700015 RepID=F2NBH5_CORGP|nr:fused MFS/spermidine synthase [Coriobacterium glomerans]AEB06711.1 Spermine synthase [Coriobacterium glomerans PW2]